MCLPGVEGRGNSAHFSLQSVVLFSPPLLPPPPPVIETSLCDQFTVEQVRALSRQFAATAPNGSMLVDTFVQSLFSLVSRQVRVCVCVCVCVCVWACIYVCICVGVYICVCMCAYVLCVYIYMCALCVCMYVYGYGCMCGCGCGCVHLPNYVTCLSAQLGSTLIPDLWCGLSKEQVWAPHPLFHHFSFGQTHSI